jgi:hypothetical protein
LARRNIDRYNKRCGDPSGYHETMTRFFLRLVHSHLNHYAEVLPFTGLVNKMAEHYPLAFIFEYYSKDRLESQAAKAGWVEPDIKMIDF